MSKAQHEPTPEQVKRHLESMRTRLRACGEFVQQVLLEQQQTGRPLGPNTPIVQVLAGLKLECEALDNAIDGPKIVKGTLLQ